MMVVKELVLSFLFFSADNCTEKRPKGRTGLYIWRRRFSHLRVFHIFKEKKRELADPLPFIPSFETQVIIKMMIASRVKPLPFQLSAILFFRPKKKKRRRNNQTFCFFLGLVIRHGCCRMRLAYQRTGSSSGCHPADSSATAAALH